MELFNSEIWGTVSDWFTAIVSAITILLVYFTFRSQQKVEKLQQESYNHQLKAYRNQHRPVFLVSHKYEGELEGYNQLDIIALYNPAIDFKCRLGGGQNIEFRGGSGTRTDAYTMFKTDKAHKIYFRVHNPQTGFGSEDLRYCFDIKLTYQDINGYEYENTIDGYYFSPKIGAVVFK